jgi:hypothetical protein
MGIHTVVLSVAVITLFITTGVLGFLLNEIWHQTIAKPICDTTLAQVDGVWIYNLSRLSDYEGQFICIRVDGQSLKNAYTTCAHEIGHEAFARICEKNITKCINLDNLVQNTTNSSQ